MIKKNDIDKIFDAARVEEVVGDYVTLKKRGVNLIGLCPFHDEKTPSFYVSPVKGIYKCFGCGKGGNSVNFLMDKEMMSYPDALKHLAKKYNIEIEETEQTPEEKIHQNERESLYVVSSFAQKHFSENLYNTDEGKSVGLGYFKERGFREDIIQKFQLGYSINQKNAFSDIAIASGYKPEYLVKSGLTIEYKNETAAPSQLEDETPLLAERVGAKYVDRFWGRVMFPIHNLGGRVIAFGGRTLRTDKKVAKYINSPETDIYHKSNVLYGIHLAKNEIAKQDNCFLVEGYTDVISMHQAGVENVVASSGTSLTSGQIKLIQKFTNNITILYDGDSAGIKASFRGIDLILEEGMNVKVLLFPDGEDPDSFSKRVSNEELKTFIKNNSKDFISFKTGLLIKEAEHDPIKKAGLIKEIIESIALIPEAIYRSVYIKECSRIMNVEENVLLNELNKVRIKNFNDKRNKNNSPVIESQQDESPNVSILEYKTEKQENLLTAEHQEKDIIRLLINYGTKTVLADSEDEEGNPIKIEVSVAQLIISELSHDNIVFENLVFNAVYNEFVTQLENNHIPEYNYFLSLNNSAYTSLIVDLISTPYQLSKWENHSIYVTKEEDVIKKSVLNAVYSLKTRKLEIMIEDIRKRLNQQLEEDEMMVLLQSHHELLETKKMLNQLLGRIIVK